MQLMIRIKIVQMSHYLSDQTLNNYTGHKGSILAYFLAFSSNVCRTITPYSFSKSPHLSVQVLTLTSHPLGLPRVHFQHLLHWRH